MGLVNCPDCRERQSARAMWCAKCGRPSVWNLLRTIVGVQILAIVLSFAFVFAVVATMLGMGWMKGDFLPPAPFPIKRAVNWNEDQRAPLAISLFQRDPRHNT